MGRGSGAAEGVGASRRSNRVGASQTGLNPERRPVYAQGEFIVAGGDRIATSTDGVQWTSRDLPAGVIVDLVARGASGTWVGASGDGQSFHYSDDGVSWEAAEAAPGNTLLYMATGTLTSCGG